MTSKMDKVFKKVLNDRDIFDSLWDRKKKKPIPKLFEEEEWGVLRNIFEDIVKNNKDNIKEKKKEFIEEVNKRKKEIEKLKGKNDWWDDKIEKLEKRAEWLKYALDEKPNLLKNLFENLEWYGLAECKLPNMNDYGRVIERYDISTVEQYFIDKIYKAHNTRGKALEKVLEYVKELHSAGVPSEEIAYFVRKLESLTKYWEIIES